MFRPKRLLRRFTFRLLQGLARILALGGPSSLRRWGGRFGGWHYRLARGSRRKLLAQMAVALNRAPDDPSLAKVLAEAYRHNDRAVLELLAMYSGELSIEEVCQLCEIEAVDRLQAVLRPDRGAILLGMHMGNGVAMATRLARDGLAVSVIYRESGKIPRDFFFRGLTRLGLNAINARSGGGAVRAMLRALRSGGVIFILMDQGTKRGGVPAEFLGKTIPMPAGTVELARRAKVPVLPALTIAAEPVWRFCIDEPVWLDSATKIDFQVAELSQIMSDHIRRQPQLWTWHHRRWKRYPFITGN